MSNRAAVAALCCAFALSAPATARTVEVRWKAGSARVAGYKIYTRFTDKPFAEGKDVGLPTLENGIHRVEIEVSDTDATWVAISAYDQAGIESPLSNERVFLLPVSGDGGDSSD
jgi:hypothetical protein